ncbi:TraB/GumN family protein [Pedobacter gandavensis]|uniref:TraB/GumN family protein n=1 Tax=Pedobacter gandavensis TaxID=2679963 RepID=UPI00292CB9DF|nr:TraB/GumN family protein [Pedobacter gandavensis]
MAKALTKKEEKSSVQKVLSQSLVLSFKNLGEIEKIKNTVGNFYIEEKDYLFTKHVKTGGSENSKFMNDKVLVERNRLWLPYILEAINNGPTFIAVGFGHLKYKEGILMQLKKKGYFIKQVDLKII